VQVEPIEPGREIGAEVHGVDLRGPIDAATADAIRAALFDHLVLVFRDQAIAPEDQVRAARAIGDPSPPEPSARLTSHHDGVPEIQRLSYLRPDGSEPPDRRPSQGDIWHTDYAYLPDPPELAMLSAAELPEDGPQTVYVDLRAAFASLPDHQRRRLEGLRALHHERGPHDPEIYRLPPYVTDEADRAKATADRYAVRPLIHAHPVTGRPSLYMASAYTVGFEGVADGEARELIERLYEHATQPQFTYSHVWRDGDVLLWDNTSTNHRRSKPFDAPRVMHRVSISLAPRNGR
jgi:alpha-ketoglutarate-dependent taurine dioxygenase